MKKFIIVFICAFVSPYIFLATFIIGVDPYYVFHRPFNMQPTKTDAPHYVARGLIRNMDYDILLCGTSMCENMHTDYIDSKFGGTSIKVIQHGSYSNDFTASLKQAARSRQADIIIMGLDSAMWKKPNEGYRIEGIPDYAVNMPNLINCLPYVFNVETLIPCIQLVKENMDVNLEKMNNWWSIDEEAYGIANVEQDWKNKKITGYGLPESNVDLAWDNYNNLVEGIEACQSEGIMVKFFIPPYSVADFSLYDYKSDLAINKEVWRKLLQYDNVEIYAIQFDTALIQCFEWYRNVNHYNGLVCDIIIDDIANGKLLLTEDNIDECVETFEQFLDNYDWDGLDKVLANH